jgi:hypothetical protein
MPADTVSPFEIAYAAVKAAIDAEFADDDIHVFPDELHESLGATEINVGIAPVRDAPMTNGRVVQETFLHVQWFDLWDPQIDPTQTVDPTPITRKAERLRIALGPLSVGLGDQVWYFNVDNTDYPRDPTGNKTRFIMGIRAAGRNAALVETVA